MALALPAFADVGAVSRYYRNVLIASAIALYVFVNVNYPLIEDPETFLAGIDHEFAHATAGHSLKIHALPHYFSFHLINSIIPGMTWPAAVLGLLGTAALAF